MDIFQAVADPVRRAILLRLRSGPVRVVDLAAAHPISRPAISRHLKVLAEAGLVSAVEHGRERYYRLETEPLDTLTDFVRRLTATPLFDESVLDGLDLEVRRTGRDRRTTATAPHPKENTA